MLRSSWADVQDPRWPQRRRPLRQRQQCGNWALHRLDPDARSSATARRQRHYSAALCTQQDTPITVASAFALKTGPQVYALAGSAHHGRSPRGTLQHPTLSGVGLCSRLCIVPSAAAEHPAGCRTWPYNSPRRPQYTCALAARRTPAGRTPARAACFSWCTTAPPDAARNASKPHRRVPPDNGQARPLQQPHSARKNGDRALDASRPQLSPPNLGS